MKSFPQKSDMFTFALGKITRAAVGRVDLSCESGGKRKIRSLSIDWEEMIRIQLWQ